MRQAGRNKNPAEQENSSHNKNLLQIARKVAGTIGSDFFLAMARHLADALAADCVLIGEFVGGRDERCRTVAAWMDDSPAEFDFALVESATAALVIGKTVNWRCDLQTRFPSDTLLASVGAQACAGVPLTNGVGHPIGVIMALFRRPVASVQSAKALLEIFARRASSELARKQEEEKLRESEQRYRAFIVRNADAMWRIEFQSPIPVDLPELEQFRRIYETGYLAECNDAMARLLGGEKGEQFTGCTVEEIAPASDLSIRHATLVGIRSGYKLTTVETSIVDAHGNRRHMLRSQWGIVEEGKLERIWGSSRDITDLKHAQMALDASEQRMADLLEAMHLMVVIVDREETIAFCNRYLYEFTRWLPVDVLGKNWLQKMIPEEEHNRVQSELANAALNPETSVHFESTLLGPDGQSRRIAWDSTVLRGHDRVDAARAMIGRDVTESKAADEHLRQAQKLSAIERLAGSVAHDFNNLLTVILGYASGLLDKMKPLDTGYISMSEIRNAAEKGGELSRRLLTFSRREILRPRAVKLNALVEETSQMLATVVGSQVRLLTNLNADSGFVRADPGQFHQVLLNLAMNARDAMPDGGTLAIATFNVEIAGTAGTSAHGTGTPPGSYVQLTVADNGIGMKDEVREHLFEPYFTTKEPGKGTGLGLSSVYGIIGQSGGHILVDTKFGRGTVFRIYLPRIEAEPVSAEDAAIRDLPRGTETILLVEDREDVRKLIAEALKDLGYTILEADGPTQAIELNREQSATIHLLVVNVGTPGLPVDELVELVKTFRPNIKILFTSAGELDVPNTLSEPGFGYLQRPFAPPTLALKIREVLDQG